jgi:hypothetical protein
MFFNAEQSGTALGAVAPEKAAQPGQEQNRNLSPQQFGKKAGPAEGVPGEAAGAEAGAGAAEGAAAAGGAEAGAAGLAELAPLLLL